MGSGPSVTSSKHVAAHERVPDSKPEQFSTANGAGMTTEGTALKSFKFKGTQHQYEHEIRVSPDTDAMLILGVDFWAKYGAVFDCRDSTI